MKKRLFAFLLAVILLSTAVFAETEFIASDCSQTHTVEHYSLKYAGYMLSYGSAIGVPMDGTFGRSDLCIPGLSEDDGMVPQGISYWEESDRILISAYDPDKERPSVIYVLDAATGELVSQFSIYNASLTPSKAHVGGIAVSENNLYLCIGKKISYVSLSQLSSSSSAIVIEGTKTLAELNGANCSYLSYGDGCIWTGNYFSDGENYNTRVSDEYASKVFGYRVSGDSSEAEWEALKNAAPVYAVSIPDSVNCIQCATVSGGTLYLNRSYGKLNSSTLFVGGIDLSMSSIVLSEGALNSFETPPMGEGIFIHDVYLYSIYESAAYAYSGANDPTDVVWRTPLSALEREPTGTVQNAFAHLHSFYQNLFGFLKSFIIRLFEYR